MVHPARIAPDGGSLRHALLPLLFVLLAAAPPARAQDVSPAVDSLVAAADRAGRSDDHRLAIELYEEALRRDSTLGDALSARLGRQYLWSDRPEPAVEWLGRALEAHPDACDVRLHYGLAQSWAGRLRPAARTYREALEACPEQAREARMGFARVLRWQEQFREGERLYRQVAAVEAGGAPDVSIGRGWTSLALYEPRAARDWFSAAWAADSSRAGAPEGLAHAYLDLGLDDKAGAVLSEAHRLGLSSPGLDRAVRRQAARSRLGIETAGIRFSDNDGTDYSGGRFTVHLPLASRTDVELTGQRWEVSQADLFSAWSSGARLHHRFAAGWAITGGAERHYFGRGGGEDVTVGDGALVWTPGDRFRLRASGGRTWHVDNLAAVRERVVGPYAGLEMGVGLGAYDALILSGDGTRWSADHRRLRATLRWTHRFEGVPRFTLDWPTRVQLYDDPFPFALWSPERYLESGPGLHMYRSLGGGLGINLYSRVGVQTETGTDVDALFEGRGSLEWEFTAGSQLRLQGGWSNSSLAGASGFQRTSAEAGFLWRP